MACYDTSCIFKKGGAEEGTEKSTFKFVHIKKGTFLFDQARKKKYKKHTYLFGAGSLAPKLETKGHLY